MGNTTRPLVVFHGSGSSKEGYGGCADGFGAAFAAWLKLGDEAEYVPQNYGSAKEQLPAVDGRDVYILDFSYPKDWMELIAARAARLIWRDHHKTAFEMWCGEYEKGMQHDQTGDWPEGAELDIFLDDNKSGAMLAWEYFHPGTEVPMLIKHIDDHDRWQFKLPGTKAFIKALWSYAPWSFEQWKVYFNNTDFEQYDSIIGQGEAILRAHDQNVQSVVKGAARKCVIIGTYDGQKLMERIGLAANCPPHLTSDVGHELATQSGTFGLCWYINKDGKCFCSLRSNGDYDVSAIAKAFGGGGHKAASGFETNVQTLLGWMK